jgi:hypothetical protein
VVNNDSFYLELYGSTLPSPSKDMYATFDNDNNLYIFPDETSALNLRRSINQGSDLGNYSSHKITYDSIDGYNDNIKYFPDNEK